MFEGLIKERKSPESFIKFVVGIWMPWLVFSTKKRQSVCPVWLKVNGNSNFLSVIVPEIVETKVKNRYVFGFSPEMLAHF